MTTAKERIKNEVKDRFIEGMNIRRRKKMPEAPPIYKSYLDRMMERHGLGAEEVMSLLAEQEDKCPICKIVLTVDSGSKGYPFLDFTKEGQQREFLCQHCLSMIKYARENMENLERAIKYLQKHKKDKKEKDA